MRRGRTIVIVVTIALSAVAAAAQGAPPGPAAEAQEYVFPSGAGVLFFHVRPERAADFESVVSRLSGALDRTPDSTRKQQAATWRIYRSAESPRDVVIYLFFFDPAVHGADYDPVKVLGEDAPADVAALYERLRSAIVRVERMGLARIR